MLLDIDYILQPFLTYPNYTEDSMMHVIIKRVQTFFFTFGAVLKANNLRFIAKMFRSLLFNASAFSRDIS